MAERGLTLKECYGLVKGKRPIAEPNTGFMHQLKAYERQIFGCNSDLPIYKSAKFEKASG